MLPDLNFDADFNLSINESGVDLDIHLFGIHVEAGVGINESDNFQLDFSLEVE